MKRFILLILLSLLAHTAFCQRDDDDNVETPVEFNYLQFKRSKFKLVDEKGLVLSHRLRENDLLAIFDGNEEALHHYRVSKSLMTAKWITRGVFGGMIIVGLGSWLTNTDNETGLYTYMAGLGGMLAIQLPIAISAGSQAGRAVDSHNMRTKKLQRQYGLRLGVTNHGLGVALNF